jgi:hypothetical protein
MPLRAMITTLVTVTIALVAVGMWVAAISPMMREADANAAIAHSSTAPASGMGPLVRGVLLLSFILVLLLLAVGVFATSREWIRRKSPERKKVRTKFVDAWKIAGERKKAEEEEPGEPLQ